MIHVAAAWASPDGTLFNMRIGPHTPVSPTDAFVLALARARADAIVTTGRILREEPDLDYTGAFRHAPDLLAFRQLRLGRSDPPWVVVLTGGAALDFEHPVFTSSRSLIVTGQVAARTLAGSGVAHAVEVIGREAPSLLDTLTLLRDEYGLDTLLVEAGPSTSSGLYEAPGHADELMLSICHLPSLPSGVRGMPFPSRAVIECAGLVEVSRQECDEPGGLWSFSRYRRV